MALTSTDRRDDYVGDGTTLTYAYNFKVTDEDHVKVIVRNPDTEVETTLTIDTDYTVTGVGSSSGGNIVLVDNNQAWIDSSNFFEDDWVLTFRLNVPLTQTTDIRNGGAFYPETHEDVFDRLTRIDLQQQDQLNRAIQLPETVDPATFDGDLPGDIVGQGEKFVGTNEDGDGWALYSASDIFEGAVESDGFALTNSMSASSVTDMTCDAADFSSCEFRCQIIRSTTIFFHQTIHLMRLNGTWVLHEGNAVGSGDSHGITWSVTESGGIAQVKVTTGTEGTGTLTFRKVTFDA
jgi:hypothetical protein